MNRNSGQRRALHTDLEPVTPVTVGLPVVAGQTLSIARKGFADEEAIKRQKALPTSNAARRPLRINAWVPHEALERAESDAASGTARGASACNAANLAADDSPCVTLARFRVATRREGGPVRGLRAQSSAPFPAPPEPVVKPPPWL